MSKISKEIANILNELNISEGNIINATNVKEWLEDCERMTVFNNNLEDIHSIEDVSGNSQVVVVTEDVLDSENREKISLFKNSLVAVVFKNPIDKQMIYELLSGHCVHPVKIDGYTKEAVKRIMSNLGYELVSEKKTYKEVVRQPLEKNIFLAEGTLVNHYLNWLNNYVKADLDVDYFIQMYQYNGKEQAETNNSTPFLSVITRTQGKRIEALRETLLSLAGQSCDDFEVLIMGHNMDDENTKLVLQTIQETPGFLQNRIRFIPVKGGNRSTPINKGFEYANGSYAVILDDDDLVFDQWVSSFKERALEYPGRVIHAYVVSQQWSLKIDSYGKEILCAEDAPNNQFCKDFHYIHELYGNSCPVLGLAFPLFPFKKMGFSFDETLDTTEDWDYLMSISILCGVAEVREVTSMYRLWKNAENSHSLHDVEVWNNNRKKIQDRMKSRPLLLPEESVSDLIEVVSKNPHLFSQFDEIAQITPLYYDIGNGYNENDVKRVGSLQTFPEIHYEYRNIEETGSIYSLRWDPSEFGNIYVENPTVVIDLENGKRVIKNIDHISSNGFRLDNKIVFFHPDPQIYVSFSKPMRITKVIVLGKVGQDITEDMHNYLAYRYNSNKIMKIKTMIKSIIKKVLRRLS